MLSLASVPQHRTATIPLLDKHQSYYVPGILPGPGHIEKTSAQCLPSKSHCLLKNIYKESSKDTILWLSILEEKGIK